MSWFRSIRRFFRRLFLPSMETVWLRVFAASFDHYQRAHLAADEAWEAVRRYHEASERIG